LFIADVEPQIQQQQESLGHNWCTYKRKAWLYWYVFGDLDAGIATLTTHNSFFNRRNGNAHGIVTACVG